MSKTLSQVIVFLSLILFVLSMFGAILVAIETGAGEAIGFKVFFMLMEILAGCSLLYGIHSTVTAGE